MKADDLFMKEIRKSRTFILGAGFSAGAGVPLTAELLSKAMNKFENECNGIFQRVNNYAKECFEIDESDEVDYSKVGFSELCTFLEYIELKEYGGGERWSSNGSKEKINLRYFLAKTLIEITPSADDIPKIYIDFVNELHERDIVISFNWDPLLERALDFVNKAYTYTFEEKKIKICKLHGSVNWRLGEASNYAKSPINLGWESMKYTEGMMDTEMYFSTSVLSKHHWFNGRRNPEIEPFLVLPGYGKSFDVRANAVMWYKPEFVFGFTHDVYIIGLSLAPDDFFIRSYFLSTLPYLSDSMATHKRTIHIINPDRSVEDNYSFVTKTQQCVIHCEYFDSKHIDSMRENRQSA
ncbi:hypothetical protein CXF76_12935 [Pseudoalteromonas sp. 78C3]|uniref:hypothetical protein n=1 Tax=Pseudoalteromonas sp. 78C3 TaxID=2058300 RepID=UPI000C347745|nr:hypothetical protein [Pseudoalteromonas sp. 78C3]PKH91162.1 hypothetical protein CXF76_12935 [Pseudoalteromonas sp. 78C3]